MAKTVKNAPKQNEAGKWVLTFKVSTYSVTNKETGEVSEKYSFKLVSDNGKMVDFHIYGRNDFEVFAKYKNRKVKVVFENYNLNTSYEYPQAFASGMDDESIITTF